MSREEIKKEIDISLNNLSDKALEEILMHLKKIETIQNESFEKEIARIFAEDKNLLQRLAS
jgi:hypothetical protein